MEQKGFVLINDEFKHTEQWPDPKPCLTHGTRDMEKLYKEALQGNIVPVMDISNGPEPKEYLVLGDAEDHGQFLWSIDERDTTQFIPVKKKMGMIIPAGMDPIQEFAWIAQHQTNAYTDHNL